LTSETVNGSIVWSSRE